MDNEEKIKEYEAHQTPVPSYDGYMTLIRAYNDVVDENTKLKELLKECKTPLEVYNEMFGNKEELLTKIDEVLK